MYYTYILRSLKDGTYYYGSVEDIDKRLDQHNRGKVRYTKGHIPYRLHYSEEFTSRAEAGQREKLFKSIAGYRWLRKEGIIKFMDKPTWYVYVLRSLSRDYVYVGSTNGLDRRLFEHNIGYVQPQNLLSP